MLSATAAEDLNFSGVPGAFEPALGWKTEAEVTGKLNYSNVIRRIGSNLSIGVHTWMGDRALHPFRVTECGLK